MHRILVYIIVGLLLSNYGFGQWRGNDWQYHPSSKNKADYAPLVAVADFSTLPWYDYPINLVILEPNVGANWNLNTIMQRIYNQLDFANDAYADIHMRFRLYNEVHVVMNTAQLEMDTYELAYTNGTLLEHYDPDAINIYILEKPVFTIFGTHTDIGGYGTYPWLPGYRDIVLLDKQEVDNAGYNWLLAHELGHLFGLLHTFGPISLYPADDFIDDTNWDNSTGVNHAPCGTSSSHPESNIMSYWFDCNTKGFTNQQKQLVRTIAERNQGNTYGRNNDFRGDCEAGDKTLGYAIVGNNSVKHIFRTSGNLVIDGALNIDANFLSKMDWSDTGGRVRIRPGSRLLPGVAIAPGTGCAGNMSNVNGGSSTEALADSRSKHTTKEKPQPTFKVYPNPFSQQACLNVDLPILADEQVLIRITDISGKVLQEEKVLAQTGFAFTYKICDLGLKRGVYVVSILYGNQQMSERLIVV